MPIGDENYLQMKYDIRIKISCTFIFILYVLRNIYLRVSFRNIFCLLCKKIAKKRFGI